MPTIGAPDEPERVGLLAVFRQDPGVSVDPQEATRPVLLACLVVFVAQSVYVVLDAPLFGYGIVVLLDALHAVLAGVLALWLWRRPSSRAAHVAFSLIALPYLVIFCLAEFQGAALGLVREPLLGHKIVMLGMALLAPTSLWLGIGLIVTFALHAAVLLAGLQGRGYRLVGVAAEPWVTFLFGAVSIAYLVARANRRAMMHRLAHLRAEAQANQRVAQLFLGFRDRVNTPLQTLELGTALLEKRCLAERRVLTALRASIARLRELSATLPTALPPPEDLEGTGERETEKPYVIQGSPPEVPVWHPPTRG